MSDMLSYLPSFSAPDLAGAGTGGLQGGDVFSGLGAGGSVGAGAGFDPAAIAGGITSSALPDLSPGGAPAALGAPTGGGAPAPAISAQTVNDFLGGQSGGSGPAAPGGSGSGSSTAVLSSFAGGPGGVTSVAPDPGATAAGNVSSISPEVAAFADTIATSAGGVTPSGGGLGALAKSIFSGAKDVAPLVGLGAGATGLIRTLTSGGPSALNPLQQEQLDMLRNQQQTGQSMMTGQLTPEMQGSIQQNVQQQINAIKQKYAQMGMTGSTAEMQDIAAATAGGQTQIANAQANMIKTGAALVGLPTNAIAGLTKEQLAQDAAFNDALAKFAGSVQTAAA